MNDEIVSIDDLTASAPTIPTGDYRIRIEHAEKKEYQSGGAGFNYRAKVVAGEHTGFTLFGMWSVKTAPGKQDMTYQTRRDWKRLGIERVANAAELIGVEGYAAVQERNKKEDGEVTEEKESVIKSWKGKAD